MLDNLLAEVQNVFLNNLTEAAAITACGAAQSASDFLVIDYANAQKNGMGKAELWTLLTSDTSATRLSDLGAQANIMQTWATTNPDLAQQSTSLGLIMYDLIVALHRERAANAPDADTQNAELADIRQYAGLAVERVQSQFDSVCTARLQAIGAPVANSWQVGGHGFRDPSRATYFSTYTVQDAWPPSQPNGVVLSVGQKRFVRNEDLTLKSQIANARAFYLKICQGGSDTDLGTWSSQLSSAVASGYFVNVQLCNLSPSQPIIQKLLPWLKTTGKWLNQAKSALDNLRNIANGKAASRSGAP